MEKNCASRRGARLTGSKSPALLALALLLLLPVAFPQTNFENYKNQQGKYFSNRMNDWFPMAIAAILICLFFNALLYMAGKGFESQKLMQYAKSEFLQVSASSMMIFFAAALLYTLTVGGPGGVGVSGFDFMGHILGTGESSLPCAAASGNTFAIWSGDDQFGRGPIAAFKCKVQEKINALENAYNNQVETNKPVERLASVCISIWGAPVWCYDWDLRIHKNVEKAHLITTKIVSLLMPLHAQYVLAEYIQKNMLTIFLPLGLVLRILPITRGVGGLFIAIAIGFFFVWPTFFLLTDPTFVRVDAAEKDTQVGTCFTGFRGSAVLVAGTIGGNALAANEFSNMRAEDLVFQITVATLFYPFIALVITLVFIRALTPLFGGDMGELMKMVSRLG